MTKRATWPRGWRRRCEAGTVAIEFAAVSGGMLLGALLILELGWQLTVEMALNAGAREASRYGVTGQVPSTAPTLSCSGQTLPAGDYRTQEIIEIVVAGSGCILRESLLSVRMSSYDGFSSVGATGGAAGAGNGSQIVQYKLSYTAPVLTGIAATLLGSSVWVHQTTLTVKNEPYSQ